uniref:Histone-lysine N-methyltransferase n=1 Tax=Strongyloides papillosus TaxID=174720 RepID=A0A0N5B6Q7_STREA
MGDSSDEDEYFQEYYDEEFFEDLGTVTATDKILFVIGRNEDRTKYLVVTDDYGDNTPMSDYIKVYKVTKDIDELMKAKINRLNDRHCIISALARQNPDVPLRMNPFAPTNDDDFDIMVKCMYLSWSYYFTTTKSFRGNKVFIVNYVDDEWPQFAYENRSMSAEEGKFKNVPKIKGCTDCDSTPHENGCTEVKKWFIGIFGDLLDKDAYLPFFECSNDCSCFRKTKTICKKRISCLNRDRIPLVIFKTADKGWALAAGKDMEAGKLVTEYVGVIHDDDETSIRSDSTYTFNMDYMREPLEEKYGPNLKRDYRFYLIDSKRFGNESRFANHSCDPNMEVIVSFGTYKCPTYHKVFYFTKKKVPMGSELTVKYFHTPGTDVTNAVKCHCGSVNCMKFLPIVQKSN